MKFYSFNGVTLWTNMSPKMSPLSKRNGSRARFVEVREREKEREGERERSGEKICQSRRTSYTNTTNPDFDSPG